ncbi:class I SAM-dependent methyltransferase [Nocardia suismassiliense]|uniref:class I SAM-dependent methyltransferase n=1 Tax=Nocardia suismassiliense TaxID=2077092 RepID=UPI000D1EDE75|nr:methionine biosynthesis protein MetW [Nocardia suismassiliense]
MRTSLIYRNATVYELLIRALYGRHYTARYRAIEALVPDGASVVDLCCGPATLYTRYLRDKSVDYTGLDRNDKFVAQLTEAGGRGMVWNLNSDTPLPEADYLVMQASLYHFLPEAAPVLDRMLTAARKQVIIAEPVRNIASSDNRVLAAIGQRFTNAGDGAQAHRFTEETLDELFRKYESRVVRQSLIAGGREKLYVLDA